VVDPLPVPPPETASTSTAPTVTALLVTDVEAAELLAISRAHLHRLRAAGRFPEAIRLGRKLLFDRAELTAWTAAKCPDLRTWQAMRAGAERRRLRAV
jgi:excisionase family DNA binding protein